MSKLVLKVNKVSYSGFEHVDIYSSMNDMTGSFALAISNLGKRLDIKMGDVCSIEIEGQEVLNGYIGQMPIKYGKDYNWLNIIGRDKTADLIDCSFDKTPNEWKNQTVGNIIKNLCNLFSITVTIDASVVSQCNTVLESYKANEGQFVGDMINELCRDNAILPVSIGDGKLTLTKATTSQYSNDGIISGINVDGAYLNQSNDDRYSSYKVKGQGIGNDNKALSDFVSCSGSFSDSVIGRVRPLVVFSELPTTIAACQKRAKWEARIRAGMSRSVEYQVPKWVQSNNDIWKINYLVKVNDDILGYDNTTMLIAAVRYYYSSKENVGECTKLLLVDKDTFNLSDNEILIKSGYDR